MCQCHGMMSACKRILALVMLCLLVGCVDPDASEVIVEPMAATLQEGERGPFGVERLTRTFRVLVDERVKAAIYFPIDSRTRSRQRGPLAVVVQGGLVASQRYAWMAEHLATRGFVAVVVEHRSELALLEAQYSVGVLEAMARDEALSAFVKGRGVVIGHSLGAVTAARLWLENPSYFSSLVMLAGVPAGGDDFSARPGGERRDRIVSLTGSRDGRISPERVHEGVLLMAKGRAPVFGYEIEGMNHMQWATQITASELENDEVATLADEEARANGLVMIDLATWYLLDEEQEDALTQEERWPGSVKVLGEEGF